MADNKETIIVGVEFDAEKLAARIQDTAKRMSELRKEAADLKKAIKEQGDADGALAVQLASVQTEIGKVQKEQKGLIATTKQLTDADTTYGDSLNEMRRRLGDLQKAYDNLSAAERESAAGQELQKKLQEQDAAVRQLEQTTGRFQRNVGNYPSAFNNVLPGLNKATAAMQKMGLTMEDLSQGGGAAFSKLGTSVKAFGKTMLTPPVGLIVGILSALMLIIQKLSAAFKKNDDAMTALSKAFAAFQPIATGISKIFDKLANGIGKALSSVADFAVKIGGKISPEFEKAAVSAAKLVVAQDELEDAEREYTVNTAERAKEISRLRNEAASTDDLAKRQKLLREAIALEQQDLEDRKKIADEKLRIAEETARQEVDTSDETKNKIAELKAAQLQAEQAYYDGVRQMEKELTGIRKEREARDKEAAKVRLAIERELQDALIELDEDSTRRAVLKAKVAGEREVEDLRIRLENLKDTDTAGRDALQKLIVAKEQETEQKVNAIVFRAAAERAKMQREYAAQNAAMYETNAIKLAQIEVRSAEARYSELAALDAEQKKALYDTDEEYYAELQAAEAQWIAAGNALLLEQYNEQKIERDNRMNEELLKVQNDEQAKTDIQLQYAQERYDALLAMDEQTKAVLYNSEEKYKQAVIAAEAEVLQSSRAATQGALKNAKQVAAAISGAMGSLSNVLDNFSQQNADAARASKAIALGKIAVETGIAIATGTAQAMDLPFPANLAAIVTTVATVLANIATAISTVKDANFGGNFAEGGFVPGTSYTGDHVNIRANSAEAVLTPAQQRNFMDLANGGKAAFDYDAMASVMAAAVAALPAPVMDYAEFTDFEQRTATYNEIASI